MATKKSSSTHAEEEAQVDSGVEAEGAQPTDAEDDVDGRGRLESLIPSAFKRAIYQGVEALSDEKVRETVVSEVVRKAIEKGHEVVDVTEDSVRRIMGEIPVAKDAADRLAARVDEYRTELFRVVGDEMHDFFDRVDLGHEIQKALTSLKLEISTEIRFIPNDRDESGQRGPVRTDVKTRTKVKRAKGDGDTEQASSGGKPRRARRKQSPKKKPESSEG